MKILDLLRKLGILRFGATSGTYTNAKERPTELMMDGVYNAEKDLVKGGEKKEVQEAPEKETVEEEKQNA